MQSFKAEKGISQKVADYIKDQIKQDVFKEGEKILTEREMALKLDVSRNTIREAYKILEAYGFLIAKHGSGFFIAPEQVQIQKMIDGFLLSNSKVSEVFAVRRLLEEKHVELAAENRTELQIKHLEKIVEDALKANDNFGQLSKFDGEFHLYLSEMSGNELMKRIMQQLLGILEKVRIHSIQIPNRADQSVHEHKEILETIRNKDKTSAKLLMKKHLDGVEQSMKEYYNL